jgi:ankyrin repeat protein
MIETCSRIKKVVAGLLGMAFIMHSVSGVSPRRVSNVIDPQAYATLTHAIDSGNAHVLSEFLHADISPEFINTHFLMHRAVEKGYSEIVYLLARAGADLDLSNARGDSPLVIAIAEPNASIIALLIALGVDLMEENEMSEVLRNTAFYHGSERILHLLDTGRLFQREAHEDLEYPDVNGLSLIHYFAHNGYLTATQALLDRGVNVNLPTRPGRIPVSSLRSTPLHYAAAIGNLAMVRLLLRNGADVNARNFAGRTPLYEAIQHGHILMVSELIDHHAEVNAADLEGVTPLHHAILLGRDAIMVQLIHARADRTMRTRDGYTPLDFARMYFQEEAEYLLQEPRAIEQRSLPQEIGPHRLGSESTVHNDEDASALRAAVMRGGVLCGR